jgi:hypothetical protein
MLWPRSVCVVSTQCPRSWVTQQLGSCYSSNVAVIPTLGDICEFEYESTKVLHFLHHIPFVDKRYRWHKSLRASLQVPCMRFCCLPSANRKITFCLYHMLL